MVIHRRLWLLHLFDRLLCVPNIAAQTGKDQTLGLLPHLRCGLVVDERRRVLKNLPFPLCGPSLFNQLIIVNICSPELLQDMSLSQQGFPENINELKLPPSAWSLHAATK